MVAVLALEAALSSSLPHGFVRFGGNGIPVFAVRSACEKGDDAALPVEKGDSFPSIAVDGEAE